MYRGHESPTALKQLQRTALLAFAAPFVLVFLAIFAIPLALLGLVFRSTPFGFACTQSARSLLRLGHNRSSEPNTSSHIDRPRPEEGKVTSSHEASASTPLQMREHAFAACDQIQRDMLAKLESWDLTQLHPKLRETGLYRDEGDVEHHVLLYKRFMFFKGQTSNPGMNPDRLCGMCSQKVDTVWHTHLLHSHDYTQLCASIFGRFIHHAPADTLSPDEEAVRSMNAWLGAYQRAFGPLPEDFDLQPPFQCG